MVVIVMMAVVVVIMVAHGVRIGEESGLCRGGDSASICRWGSGEGTWERLSRQAFWPGFRL
jgi:hypothetical protein